MNDKYTKNHSRENVGKDYEKKKLKAIIRCKIGLKDYSLKPWLTVPVIETQRQTC